MHTPVLVAEVVRFLNPNRDGIYVDCTLGAGGHTLALLERCARCRVIGLDVDPDALSLARERLSVYERSGRIKILRESYTNITSILRSEGIEKVDGLLADLGVSSMHLDNPSRGFSFKEEGPLDMRMNPSADKTAYEVVNFYEEEKIAKIISEYGQERFAKRIAREIVKSRPIRTTKDLVEAVSRAIPPAEKRKRKRHFATKTFQAIRIEVNNELGNIKVLLEQAVDVMKVGGRIAVISFHSLEDRIVKNHFRNSEKLKVITKKPVTPTERERRTNPRSRSAKLRVAERI